MAASPSRSKSLTLIKQPHNKRRSSSAPSQDSSDTPLYSPQPQRRSRSSRKETSSPSATDIIRRHVQRCQAQIAGFPYNPNGATFNVDKNRSLANLLVTGRAIRGQTRRPIQCVEGVLVAIMLTQDIVSIERFGLSFKAIDGDGVCNRHLVLGIYAIGMFGAIGISRNADLMNKPLKYKTLYDLLIDYNESWKKANHTLQTYTLSRPIPHHGIADERVNWTYAILDATDDASVRKWSDAYQNVLKTCATNPKYHYTMWDELHVKLSEGGVGEEGPLNTSRVVSQDINSSDKSDEEITDTHCNDPKNGLSNENNTKEEEKNDMNEEINNKRVSKSTRKRKNDRCHSVKVLDPVETIKIDQLKETPNNDVPSNAINKKEEIDNTVQPSEPHPPPDPLDSCFLEDQTLEQSKPIDKSDNTQIISINEAKKQNPPEPLDPCFSEAEVNLTEKPNNEKLAVVQGTTENSLQKTNSSNENNNKLALPSSPPIRTRSPSKSSPSKHIISSTPRNMSISSTVRSSPPTTPGRVISRVHVPRHSP